MCANGLKFLNDNYTMSSTSFSVPFVLTILGAIQISTKNRKRSWERCWI